MTDEATAPVEETIAPATTEEAVTTNTDEGTAPVEETAAPDADKQNGVQKKINKEVARRGAAERRADKAERELKEFQSKQQSAPTSEPVMPIEADFNFDTDKFNVAMSNYHRDVATKATQDVIAANNKTVATNATEAKRQEIETGFWAKADKSNIDGFAEKLGTLPTFNNDTLDTIMMAENAPELADHLANHLDVAYEIASMSTAQAGMKLGQIAAALANKKPTNKISNAPDPIDPINQGGATTGDEWDKVGGDATYE